jgi:hypothetical protein
MTPREAAGPYRIEREEVACPCDNCIEWLVVGPDGVALGQSWVGSDGAEEAAQDKADDMNAAWEAARRECADVLMALGLTGCTGPECTCLPGDIAERCEAVRALAAKWRTT